METKEKITSLQNARVKKWTALHHKKDRDEAGLFLAEGEHLIEEALKEGLVETIITDAVCPFDFADVVEVTPQIMKKLSQNISAVHLIAVCRKKEDLPDDPKRVVILDGVQDPGNLGTIIRTAVSFSFDAVYLSDECADLYNDKTIRSTQGALFRIPVIRTQVRDLIRQLQKEDFRVFATCLQESSTMSQIPPEERMAFVFGNEGQGVSPDVIAMCDDRIRIEMNGFESLNVAVAAGIVMYTYRQ